MTSNFHNFASVGGRVVLWTIFFRKGFQKKKRSCQVHKHLEQQTTPPKILHYLPPLLAGRFGKKTSSHTGLHRLQGQCIGPCPAHAAISDSSSSSTRWVLKILAGKPRKAAIWKFRFFSKKKLKQRLGKGCSSLFTNHLSKMIHHHPVNRTV